MFQPRLTGTILTRGTSRQCRNNPSIRVLRGRQYAGGTLPQPSAWRRVVLTRGRNSHPHILPPLVVTIRSRYAVKRQASPCNRAAMVLEQVPGPPVRGRDSREGRGRRFVPIVPDRVCSTSDSRRIAALQHSAESCHKLP